jgi:hypothetical protein
MFILMSMMMVIAVLMMPVLMSMMSIALRLFVGMSVWVMMMFVFVLVMPFALTLFMRGTLVDAELHSFDLVSLRTVEVHVEIAEIELRQLPFERGRFHAEIDQRADGHVAADAGTAIEIKDFQGKLRVEC